MTIIGEDDQPYILQASIDLTDPSSNLAGGQGTKIVNPASNKYTITGLMFSDFGSKTINVKDSSNAAVTIDIPITVSKSKLVISSLSNVNFI